MSGFLAGTIINATVDAATGYATTEVVTDGTNEHRCRSTAGKRC